MIFSFYSVVSTRKKYSYVKGRSWLMPVVWMLRIISTMKNNRVGKSIQNLTVVADQDKVDMIQD